ncbi:MAG: hypothetical protein LBT40_14640 [Deltaproteobacteria bacterium]|jgi:hypothetical protein|nr:hypothetical protein [Deltaproteobacteria bacterium]
MNPVNIIRRFICPPAVAGSFSGAFCFSGSDTDSGTEGWPVFDSARSLPSSVPGFTISYPPLFRPADGYRPLRLSDGEFLQNFHFTDDTTMSNAVMEISRSTMTQNQQVLLDTMGIKTYAKVMSYATSMAAYSTVDETETCIMDGHKRVDMFLTGTKETHGAGDQHLFGTMRNLFVRNSLFVFSCFSCYPSWEATNGGYTSRDNPIFKKFGLPALDSIKFSF